MQRPIPNQPPGARFLLGIFGFVFFGIGVTVLVFMWFGTEGFGEPPVFFKIFASFIALAFVGFGGTMCAGALFGSGMMGERSGLGARVGGGAASAYPGAASAHPGVAAKYVCPSCGAALGDKAEVSPLGDTKCPHCGGWFNIHGRSR